MRQRWEFGWSVPGIVKGKQGVIILPYLSHAGKGVSLYSGISQNTKTRGFILDRLQGNKSFSSQKRILDSSCTLEAPAF